MLRGGYQLQLPPGVALAAPEGAAQLSDKGVAVSKQGAEPFSSGALKAGGKEEFRGGVEVLNTQVLVHHDHAGGLVI